MIRHFVTQVHVPRTGGTALCEAMRSHRFWRMAGHRVTLEDATTDLAVVTLRDPVARFISVCAWGRDVLAQSGYRDAEAAALDIINATGRLDDTYRMMLQPQAAWCVSAEYVRDRCFWWGFTETLDEDFERLRALLELDETYTLPAVGERKRNAAPVEWGLSAVAEANVRDWYAVDAQMLEGLA